MGRISKYTAVSAPADTDALPTVQAGVTKKVLLSVLKTFFRTMDQIPTPDSPAAGKNIIYPKSDNKLYILHSDGTEVEVGASAQAGEGLIGTPGAAGFAVGICPLANLPTGMTPLAGYNVVGDSNYGNYQLSDGSVMVFIPKFYYRIAHASNPTYAVHGVNSIDVKGIDTYADTAAANAAGYALHRAFIDGGVEQPGVFVDKYKCSKNVLGTGYVASSILNGLPLSSAAAHNPFSGCTGGADAYYSTIDLAHRRDGVNGAVNADSIFFCASIFIHAALAMLSLAHGQAAVSTANCAWYHATYNYPKGLNNNNLAAADADDNALTYVTDGYSNCGKTGSGSPFAKTTHNGQTCGVADLNGLMWEISIGATCIATSPAIEAMTAANPCKLTITAHGKATGDYAQVNAITQASWLNLKDKIYKLTKIDDNNFTLDGIDTSSYEASVAIAGMSRAAACVVTWVGHGLTGANNKVRFAAITQADWTALNGTEQTITVIDVDSFSIAVNTSGYAADYDAGTDPGTVTKGVYNAAVDAGTITKGVWYAAKEATAMKEFTNGNSVATDHWGATGAAAMMEIFVPVFETSGGGAFAQRMGSGANQVLSEALSGANRLLTGIGSPKDANGIDTTGTNLFGKDYWYQYIANELCLLHGGTWPDSTYAGVWHVAWSLSRTTSYGNVGFRAACYPD